MHVSYLFKFSRFKFAFLEVHGEVLKRENQFSRFRSSPTFNFDNPIFQWLQLCNWFLC
jgi:hypothetical protein